MTRLLHCGSRVVDISNPCVMGILNVTPDSFSDGGRYGDLDAALLQAARMVAEGAAFIDVGGESARPGAAAISVQQELDRVLPVVERLVRELDVAVSVDTSTPEVMQAVAAAGAHLINDVRALQRPGALAAAAATRLPVCLMHMQGEPGTMQQSPHYDDVLREVSSFLTSRLAACVDAGMTREQLLIDPGFGFGKTLAHNLALLDRLDALADGSPLLVGLSRKSMVGALLAGKDGKPRAVEERLHGSVALAAVAALKGANIVRVHDVAPTVDALAMVAALKNSSRKQ